ncbi:testis-specific serine kinase substrate [Ambystoma mexicanum]|uniref:testis-specific serine kinase substrate n=1 Tax=Ambystoma mexicanum TaxID=8296 RepID=UPI0037E8A297
MTAVFLKTIWQSEEINVGGNQGADDKHPNAPEASENEELLTRRKKAVSFHGVEPPKVEDCMDWRLMLKRSSASTNVSILNLTEVDNDESTESEPTEEGSEIAAEAVESLSDQMLPDDSETDQDIMAPLEAAKSSRLGQAKDSVTDLKRKTSKINRNVKILQENCRKVRKSVEDAEIKTSALKQNSLFLEEKLNYLRQQVQEEDLGKREKEWQEVEEKLAAGFAKDTADALFVPLSGSQKMTQGPEDLRIRELHRAITVIVASIGSLQYNLEKGSQEARRGVEFNLLQEVKAMSSALNGVRDRLLDLEGKFEKSHLSHKDVHRIVSHVSGRFDAFLPQWERSQREQTQITQTVKELQSNTDEISASLKRITLSLSQLRTDMDGLSQVKPLLEELSRLSLLKLPEESVLPGFTRYSSPSVVNTESLKHVIEVAMAPVLEELKTLNQSSTCPGCQRLQKKNLVP